MQLWHSTLQRAQRGCTHRGKVEHAQEMPLTEGCDERRKIVNDFIELELRDVRAVQAVND